MTSKEIKSTIFLEYPWHGGAKRCELESWLKERTGFTSNRAMQTIINNGLADGVIGKNLTTRKYHLSKYPNRKAPYTPAP